MNEYSDYRMIEEKIRSGMWEGNRHLCRRDVGRIAGGHLASGRISPSECDNLRQLCISLSTDGAKIGAREWDEAVEYGRQQPLKKTPQKIYSKESHSVGWDEVVNPDDYKVVDLNWLESESVEAPADDWNFCSEMSQYLTLLFDKSEYVAFLSNPPKIDGKYSLRGGVFHKTVKELLKSLKKGTREGLEEAIGTPNEESGAWIVVNPIDGKGRKDANITAYRHVLIESDTLPIDEQVAIYKKLELPCAAIVHSGGKSAHAIVRVDAADKEEYQKRVDFLFKVCEQNGLAFDHQNRNPSRFTRLPGVMRNGNKQFLISGRCGKPSWEDWEGWIKEQNDNLPDFETLTGIEIDNPPEPLPELIEGILRVDSKMIIAGPPKAGKSFLLIELAIAIAEGGTWLGCKCAQGRVLYVNLELHKDSCTRRFAAAYKVMDIPVRHNDFIDRWNLRGCTEPMDKLTPKLIRRAKDRGYALIIIDPIYKVLTGDENSASDMAQFSCYFDKIAKECGCAIAFCHHHSKGAQGDKRSMDRASGSGVFTRDTDALVDLIMLDAENARKQIQNRFECEAMLKVARTEAYDDNWEQQIAEDDKLVPNRLIARLPEFFDEDQMHLIRNARAQAIKDSEAITAWRCSFMLREFATPKPKNIWFIHPRHLTDEEQLLDDCSPDSTQPSWKAHKKEKAPRIDKMHSFKVLLDYNPNEEWTVEKAAEQMSVSVKSVRRYCQTLGWSIEKGKIVRASKEEKQDDCPF